MDIIENIFIFLNRYSRSGTIIYLVGLTAFFSSIWFHQLIDKRSYNKSTKFLIILVFSLYLVSYLFLTLDSRSNVSDFINSIKNVSIGTWINILANYIALAYFCYFQKKSQARLFKIFQYAWPILHVIILAIILICPLGIYNIYGTYMQNGLLYFTLAIVFSFYWYDGVIYKGLVIGTFLLGIEDFVWVYLCITQSLKMDIYFLWNTVAVMKEISIGGTYTGIFVKYCYELGKQKG